MVGRRHVQPFKEKMLLAGWGVFFVVFLLWPVKETDIGQAIEERQIQRPGARTTGRETE